MKVAIKSKFLAIAFGGAVLAFAWGAISQSTNRADAYQVAKDPATERTRREVRMLDDIYKTAIVLVTTHYVTGKESLPAGSAFKALFAAVKEKGWHEVRLLDATGDPYEPSNAPKEGFEQRAVKKILGGEAYYDEVVTENNKKFLLAATTIPVVMEKCTVCHENYKGVAKGKAIGALGYKLPILD
ncbi:MAG: DUF3365 domain-containing protein [Pirellula sp.]